MQDDAVYEGVLFGWAETGTEGVIWALQESKHIRDNNSWDYAGLKTIQQDDFLTVFKDSSLSEVLWEGPIRKVLRFMDDTIPEEVHWRQAGVPYEQWQGYFTQGLQGRIVRKNKDYKFETD